MNWLSPSYALNATYDFIGLHTEIVKENTLNSSALVLNLNVSDAHIPQKLSIYYFAPVVPPAMVARGLRTICLGLMSATVLSMSPITRQALQL